MIEAQPSLKQIAMEQFSVLRVTRSELRGGGATDCAI